MKKVINLQKYFPQTDFAILNGLIKNGTAKSERLKKQEFKLEKKRKIYLYMF